MFYSVGITVKYGYAGDNKYGWNAECNWQDGKFMEDGTMEGIIRTRYFESTITKAVDYILEVMRQFNIQLCNEVIDMDFSLFRDEEEDYPEELLQQIREEAEKHNWKVYF